MEVREATGAPAGASTVRPTAGPAGRAGGMLMGFACAVMLLTWIATLRDGSVVTFPASVVVMLMAMVAVSPLVVRWAPSWPPWFIHALCAGCTVAVTFGLVQIPSLTPQIASCYVIVVLFASYYLPRWTALAMDALCTACFAGALLAMPGTVELPPPSAVESWLPIAGAIAITGVFLSTVRAHRDGLVAAQQVLRDRLEASARTDVLTGLLNRHGFERRAAERLARAGGTSTALIVGDVDLLKALNEAHGQAAGDRTLRRVADVISQRSRRMDVAGRTGGEEFAILAPTAEVSDAVALAERLRRDVMIAFGDEPFDVTISFGVAMYPRDGESLDELMISADRALLTAKRAGRNRTMLAAQAGEHTTMDAASQDHDERARLVTAIGLAEALDLRDTGTASHSQTVARYAAMMAQELGLPASEIERIRVAGLLHDIGKIGVPDAILNKPGKLTEDEYAEMQRHPEIGARILGSDVLDDVRQWVLAHHERPDGRGYPFGLTGEQVPLQARILAVADAYEAMTADRVYRKAMPREAARAELQRCRGSQFDPVVTDAFLALLDRIDAEGDGLDTRRVAA